MFLVMQTNEAEPKQAIVNGIEPARLAASDFCPMPGDQAVIYRLIRVGSCRAIQTVEFTSDPIDLGEDSDFLMGEPF